MGMFYLITETNGSYNHLDFLKDDFTAAQYFLLMDLLNEQAQIKQKAYKDSQKKSNKK